MDASSRAARIDLICCADARHLVRSLEQALALRGLQVTLRDFEQPARAPIGVAVLTEDGPTSQQWHNRLEAYASRSMIAFEQALAPPGTEVFVLSGWPSRRADQVLAELADYLVRELASATAEQSRRAPKSRESGPLVALGVVVALVVAMIYLLDSSAGNAPVPADPAEELAVTQAVGLEPAVFDIGAADFQPGTLPDHDDGISQLAEVSSTPGSVTTGGVARRQLSSDLRAKRKSASCSFHGIGTVPPAHLFSWRPVVQAPEVPRIWAMVQPQYYLPEYGDCD